MNMVDKDLLQGIQYRLNDIQDARAEIDLDFEEYNGEAVAKAIENIATAIHLILKALEAMNK
jgi:hypothetical protein